MSFIFELQKSCKRGQNLARCGLILQHDKFIYQIDAHIVRCRKMGWYVESKRIRNAKIVSSIPASGIFFHLEVIFSYPLCNSLDSKLYVLRFTGIPIDQDKFSETIFGPLRTTKYQYIVDGSKAPSVTNCVTAIRYLLAKSCQQKLPSIFIGDMPRVLMAQCGYAVQQIKLSEMRCGDLIFFKWNSSNTTYFHKRYICHIAIAIGPSMIFHSAQDRGGGSIENLVYPADQYAKTILEDVIDQPFLFLRYIDPRNIKLRSQFESEFLPFPVYKSLTLKTYIPKKVEESAA